MDQAAPEHPGITKGEKQVSEIYSKQWFLWRWRSAMERALKQHDNDHARALAWTAYLAFESEMDRGPSAFIEAPGTPEPQQ